MLVFFFSRWVDLFQGFELLCPVHGVLIHDVETIAEDSMKVLESHAFEMF